MPMQKGRCYFKKTLLWCNAVVAISWLLSFTPLVAQQRVITISELGKWNEVYFHDSLWLFYPGELSREKLLSSNTAMWDTLRHTDFGVDNPPKNWQGSGWFGIWIRVDSTWIDRKMSLRINHDGASEIYIDGKPIGGYGKVGKSKGEMDAVRAPKDLIPIWFQDTMPHLLTIHYSNFTGVYPDFLGFKTSIGDYETLEQRMADYNRLYDFVPLCAAAQIILACLHFFLFFFYPKQKLNLYYSLFVLLIGINSVCIYLYYQTRIPEVQYLSEFLATECKVLIMWSAVMLLHILNYGHVPLWRQWALTALSAAYIVLYFFTYIKSPLYAGNNYFSLVFFLCAMDGLWSVVQIVKRKQRGAWLIVAGVVTVILLYFFAWDDTFQLWPYQLNAMRIFVLGTGQLVLPLCLSLYLALDFSATSQRLSMKLQEVENLSARALAQEAEKTELIAGEARRLEETVRERTMELRETADKLLEMDALKSRFFTNITHEFRTPLTLIINPAKEISYTSADTAIQQQARLIVNNATRLLELVNQLLDLSKLESGLMPVYNQPLDIVALFRMHTQSYSLLGKHKNITIRFASDWDTLWIAGDRDKLEKIILNLLSNAIKFTDAGSIAVSLQKDSEANEAFVCLNVHDTGRGIAASKLPYIFSRFYQADASDTRTAEGTGIGLALTKEMVELLGGEITVNSVEQQFTVVSVRLPYSAVEPLPELNIYDSHHDVHQTIYHDVVPVDDTTADKPLILLIEDHDELRQFMQQLLTGKYRVLGAANGSEGIALGMEHIPNLIITDVMMPGVDGYQVCTSFKNDERTSHIPVIMLTAKTNMDSRVHGIETGADAYLGKPFDKRELFALIENLIQVRDKLRERYSKKDLWFSNAVAMPTLEQEFIARVRKAVEDHLDDEGFGTDQLALTIGLSRTQLHRKLKALIGHAPGELIRIVRLQHAHNLLKNRVATVSEVAYMVGFSSPASFSASFSRHFGFPPKTLVTV